MVYIDRIPAKALYLFTLWKLEGLLARNVDNSLTRFLRLYRIYYIFPVQ